jgi:hypothetical protein
MKFEKIVLNVSNAGSNYTLNKKLDVEINILYVTCQTTGDVIVKLLIRNFTQFNSLFILEIGITFIPPSFFVIKISLILKFITFCS